MPRPLKYLRVKQSILRRIASGEIGPGDSAGSEAGLCREHGVSKFTVIKAFTELVSEGVLYRRQGKGTFVTEGSSYPANGSASSAPAGRGGTVRLLRPFRQVSLDHLSPALQRFRERFGPGAIEITDDPELADVTMVSVALGSDGAGRLLPLDHLLAASDLADAYDDDVLGLFRRGRGGRRGRGEGSLYALPRDYSPVLLFYNADIFQRSGIEPPDESWTWDDLARAADKLTDRDAGVFGYGAGRGMIFLGHFLRQSGGTIVDAEGRRCVLDSPESVEAIRFYRGLERSSPITAARISYEGVLDAFVEGRIAMMAWGGALGPMLGSGGDAGGGGGGESGGGDGGFRWGAAPLPRGRASATVFFAAGLAILKTAGSPEFAWELVRELAGPEAQAGLAQLGYYLPAARGVEAQGDLADMMRRELPHAARYRTLTAGDAYHVASEQMIGLWDEIEDDVKLARELAARVNMFLELSRSKATERFEAATL